MIADKYYHYDELVFLFTTNNNPLAIDQLLNDTLGCEWNIAGNYGAHVFQSCFGDSRLVCHLLRSFILFD